MAKQPNTQHLKQGKLIPDPVHVAKLEGTAFSDTTNFNKVYPDASIDAARKEKREVPGSDKGQTAKRPTWWDGK